MANKRGYELDARVQKVIDETFADFEKYLPCSQDVHVYRRKRKEYWEKVSAKLAEEALRNGRADDTSTGE